MSHFPTNAHQSHISVKDLATHQPVATTDDTRAAPTMFAKRKHAQLAALNNHKDVEPILGPGALPSGFPVLLAAEHALLCPRRTEQCEFLIRDTNCG